MRFLKAYLPAALWMAVIFMASTDIGSSQRTSRIIGPALRFFFPSVTDETIHAVQTVVRKSGHLAEYAILAGLFWRARCLLHPEREPWSGREMVTIVAWCALYAVTDEVHQSFVGSRQGSPWDVLLDAAGAWAGLVFLRLAGWARLRWGAGAPAGSVPRAF